MDKFLQSLPWYRFGLRLGQAETVIQRVWPRDFESREFKNWPNFLSRLDNEFPRIRAISGKKGNRVILENIENFLRSCRSIEFAKNSLNAIGEALDALASQQPETAALSFNFGRSMAAGNDMCHSDWSSHWELRSKSAGSQLDAESAAKEFWDSVPKVAELAGQLKVGLKVVCPLDETTRPFTASLAIGKLAAGKDLTTFRQGGGHAFRPNVRAVSSGKPAQRHGAGHRRTRLFARRAR